MGSETEKTNLPRLVLPCYLQVLGSDTEEIKLRMVLLSCEFGIGVGGNGTADGGGGGCCCLNKQSLRGPDFGPLFFNIQIFLSMGGGLFLKQHTYKTLVFIACRYLSRCLQYPGKKNVKMLQTRN